MLDEAIGLTLSSCLGPEEFPVTVEIKVCFIAGTKSGRWSEPERLSTWAVPFALSKDA
jgi:acyl-coenzyme A thioesterase PaaI-like protein